MRKKLSSIIGAAVATAALVAPSSAQAQTASVSGTAVNFAKEIFSPGSNPEIDLNRVAIVLTYDLSTNNINVGRVADITYTLSEGTFADAPAKPVFSEGALNTAQPTKMTISDGIGATVGSSRVTYRVTSAGGAALSDAVSRFTFTVPRLKDVASALSAAAVNGVEPSIKVVVTVRPLYTSQTNAFPAFPAMTTPEAQQALTVATSAGYVTVGTVSPTYPTPNATTTAAIINTDDPTKLVTVADRSARVTGVPGGATIGVIVSQIQVGRNVGVRTEDGTSSFTPMTGDKFIVQAMGNFASGDILFYSTDAIYSRAEMLTINGQTARLEMELLPALSNVQTALYYVPAAGNVREGTVSSSYIVDIRQNEGAYTGPTIVPGNVMVSYSGITNRGYAYALPNPASGDIGNLRIRCQGSAACEVFLQCMDMAGARVGDGTLKRMTIAAGAVETLSTRSSLPELLGISTWTGRLSCDIMANREIGVQLLVRSGDTLTNNTYIGGELTNK